MPRRGIRAVLFDLDGTLIDTAPDLAWATNALRAEFGRPALDYALIRPWVSHGGTALTRLALECPVDAPGFAAARARLLDLYRGHLAIDSRAFPGIATLLTALSERGLLWGIVTNKPAWLTDPLLRALAFEPTPGCVVSGDSLPQRKPHPEPLCHAAAELGLCARDCVYIGDAERDIQAARAAGMPGLVACYGYLAASDEPSQWGAAALLDQALDLLDWLEA